MAGSHEKLPWLFWVQLILVAIVGTLYLLAPAPEKHGESAGEGAAHEVSAASKQALKPIGEVAVNNASGDASGGAARTGKEVVEKTCQTCHANGVANAPRLDDSARADWEARYANGMDSLMKNAIDGKGAMPPKGTDPSLTEAELKGAIVYMLEKVGITVSEASGAVAASEVKETAAPEASANTSSDNGSAEADTVSASVAVEAETPEAPQAPAAPEPPEAAASAEVAAPDAGESSSSVAPVAETVAATTTTEAAGAAEKSTINGAKIYNTACFACHGTGAAGAPKLGDKAAWEARIATGTEALYQSAIKGKGAMPPKGGSMNLSDDEVKAVVDHMISQSQ